MIVAIARSLPVVLSFFWLVHRYRVPPFIVWLVLTWAWFGTAMVFAENRPKWRQFMVEAPIFGAIGAGAWLWLEWRDRVQKRRRHERQDVDGQGKPPG
jgi:hypothetical protein